jgi:DNA-directed RNA polymerase specialized sigma24 family protein
MEIETSKEQHSLSQEAFDRLLFCLDADRSRAGEKYETLRRKLVSFFRWRGSGEPENHADRAIDRGAKRLQEGARLHVDEPYAYFHGVALNVLREHWRESDRERERVGDLTRSQTPAMDADEEDESEAERQAQERRLTARRRLAATLDTSLRALRIRVYRIRRVLETCVETCVKRAEAETNFRS